MQVKGFTIIELVIVVSILGILAAVVGKSCTVVEKRLIGDDRPAEREYSEKARPGPDPVVQGQPFPGDVHRYDTEDGPIWIIKHTEFPNITCVATRAGLWCK